MPLITNLPSCQEGGGELGEARLLSGDAYLAGIGGGGQWVHFAIDLKDHSGHVAQVVAVDVKLKNTSTAVQVCNPQTSLVD